MAQVDAALQATFGVDPRALSDPEWCDLYAKYKYLGNVKQRIITNAVIEAWNAIVKAQQSDNE